MERDHGSTASKSCLTLALQNMHHLGAALSLGLVVGVAFALIAPKKSATLSLRKFVGSLFIRVYLGNILKWCPIGRW